MTMRAGSGGNGFAARRWALGIGLVATLGLVGARASHDPSPTPPSNDTLVQ